MEEINFDEKIIANYIEAIRPPEEMRHKLDVGYSFENNEVVFFEIRPQWNDESIIHHYPFVKAKYVKSQKKWKIYWMRANEKWELYEPNPTVRNINSFIEIVEEDEHGYFRG
ncbi:MAG TPA: DUF3024 domain-containing protein [Draconibacterium sp.]|nr:DUF3024 domain-containing protein [Draconibacterium sp.]